MWSHRRSPLPRVGDLGGRAREKTRDDRRSCPSRVAGNDVVRLALGARKRWRAVESDASSIDARAITGAQVDCRVARLSRQAGGSRKGQNGLVQRRRHPWRTESHPGNRRRCRAVDRRRPRRRTFGRSRALRPARPAGKARRDLGLRGSGIRTKFPGESHIATEAEDGGYLAGPAGSLPLAGIGACAIRGHAFPTIALALEKWFTDWIASGSEEFEGQACDRLYATTVAGNRVQVFLRKDTRRLLGLRLLADEPNEGVTMVFETWTQLSGLAVPERVRMDTAYGAYVARLSNYGIKSEPLPAPDWVARP